MGNRAVSSFTLVKTPPNQVSLKKLESYRYFYRGVINMAQCPYNEKMRDEVTGTLLDNLAPAL